MWEWLKVIEKLTNKLLINFWVVTNELTAEKCGNFHFLPTSQILFWFCKKKLIFKVPALWIFKQYEYTMSDQAKPPDFSNLQESLSQQQVIKTYIRRWPHFCAIFQGSLVIFVDLYMFLGKNLGS